MELHERLVSALLGALWGALLGVLVSILFHYVIGREFSRGYLIVDWKNTILACSVVFAIAGLIFKASAGTMVGALMGWVWSAIEYYRQLYKGSFLVFLVSLAIISYWFYTMKKS